MNKSPLAGLLIALTLTAPVLADGEGDAYLGCFVQYVEDKVEQGVEPYRAQDGAVEYCEVILPDDLEPNELEGLMDMAYGLTDR